MREGPSADQAESAPRQSRSPSVLLDEAEVLDRLEDDYPHVVLDLDETLLLRSSTELYLGSLRPRVVAQPVLLLLDVSRPWRVLPGPRKQHVYRDWLRVLVASVLLPWSLPLWRRTAPWLGEQHVNRPLRDAARALVSRGAVLHVVTLGFRPVVAPLLRGAGLPEHRLISSRLAAGWRLRRAGKASALGVASGPDVVASAVVVTDSLDDLDLLEACATPLHVRWRQSRWEEAFAGSYQPFLYTRRGKRAGQKYLLHHVLLEDVLLLVLALAWSMPQPLLGAVGLLLLHLSFWTVYEIGYWENDTLAVARESHPNIPVGAAEAGARMKPRMAWLTAVVLSGPGVVLLAAGAGTQLRSTMQVLGDGPAQLVVLFAAWMMYLLLSRGIYWTYNRLDPQARVLPYAGLQVTRTIGYCVFCLVTPVGAAALLAVVLVRWMIYVAYRGTGVQPVVSHRLLLLFSFLVLSTGAVALDPAGFGSAQFVTILAVLAVRAHGPLGELARLLARRRSGHAPSAQEPRSQASSSSGH